MKTVWTELCLFLLLNLKMKKETKTPTFYSISGIPENIYFKLGTSSNVSIWEPIHQGSHVAQW